MSPGATFERVYLALKRQLREGTRPPGTPLEPTAIGDELGTSFTPVRDALHRLVGEGLVDTPRHNGFAVPHPTEQALRDLYAWNGEVLAMLVSRAKHELVSDAGLGGEYAASPHEKVAAMFGAIAASSGNREHVRAVAQLNDRLAPYRLVEPRALPQYEEEAAALMALNSSSPSVTARMIARYHRRRMLAAPHILSELQSTT